MRQRIDLFGEGYAANLRDKIEKGSSAYTHINPYDYSIIKQKLYLLDGIEQITQEEIPEADGMYFRIELMREHPQGYGNSFDTHFILDSSVTTGNPRFSFPYGTEEILFYQLTDVGEEGILLSVEGEILVC
jgi:hypothetical protein